MRVLLSLFLLVFVGITYGQDSLKNDSISIDIYILIGQSNMAGRGEFKEGDLHEIDNVLLFNNQNEFEVASNPLNQYSSIRKSIDMQKMGLGYSFAKTLHGKLPKKKIGLVVNARGGSSIKEWEYGSEYFSEVVKRARRAAQYGEVKGILWHQGESDQNDAKSYSKKFRRMVKHIRKSLRLKKTPVFIGEIGKWRDSSKDINKVFQHLASKNKDIYLISASGLTHKGDNTHFSRESQIELGKRYANKVYNTLYE